MSARQVLAQVRVTRREEEHSRDTASVTGRGVLSPEKCTRPHTRGLHFVSGDLGPPKHTPEPRVELLPCTSEIHSAHCVLPLLPQMETDSVISRWVFCEAGNKHFPRGTYAEQGGGESVSAVGTMANGRFQKPVSVLPREQTDSLALTTPT